MHPRLAAKRSVGVINPSSFGEHRTLTTPEAPSKQTRCSTGPVPAPGRRATFCGILAALIAGSVAGACAAPPVLSIAGEGERAARLSWPMTASNFVLESAVQLATPTRWTAVAQSPSLQADHYTVTLDPAVSGQFFRLRAVLATIQETSPVNGEDGVSVTRETVIRLSRPLAPDTVLTTNHLFARLADRRLLSRVDLSSDRRTATLFYLEPLPGSTHLVVVFDPQGLADEQGLPLDPDGDGQPGGIGLVAFDTLSIAPVSGTEVYGRVFASELQPGPDTGTNAIQRPLAGVTITVDGMEESLRATTDAGGNFRLLNCPAGRFFVHIDGRTAPASQWPAGDYYPVVGKVWEGVPGSPMPAAGTGEIFLPLIRQGTLQPVSLIQDTRITFPPRVVADNPALAGVSLLVPANSLFSDNGTRGGQVGIAPVPPDRLPGPLPPGLDFPLVITIQTDGPQNFDRPVPVCFPNLPDPRTGEVLPPGARSAIWSFNHDTGEWEVVGPATVSEDGRLVCSDPGVGIRQPGWHGTLPGCPGTAKPPEKCDCAAIRGRFEAFRNRNAGGSSEGYAAQMECIARKACENESTFGGGFIKDVFCDISLNPEGRTALGPAGAALEDLCYYLPNIPIGVAGVGVTTADACSVLQGFGNHFASHLLPFFIRHCEKIDPQQHDQFFGSAVGPCFQENKNNGLFSEAGSFYGEATVPIIAAAVRELARAVCPYKDLLPVGLRAGRPGFAPAGAGQPGLPVLPPPPSRELLFQTNIAALGTLQVQAPGDRYFLTVGETVTLQVQRRNPDGTRTDLTGSPDLRFYATADSGDVQVLPDGRIRILRTQSPTRSLPSVFAVLVTEGSGATPAAGIGQFATTDVDTDGDGIVDSYEVAVGLDPRIANGPQSDLDGDRLSDFAEALLQTNPLKADTDGDGSDDGAEVEAGTDPLNAAQGGLSAEVHAHFYLLEDLDRGTVLRGQTSSAGILRNVVLAPNRHYRFWEWQPGAGLVGSARFTTPDAGTAVQLPTLRLRPDESPDSDIDGLPDVTEFILGTDADDFDTDDDGIGDGAETAQGTNPLDGLAVATGVIASTGTLGPAVDVATFNHLAVVAEGAAGVGVYNIFNGMSPVLVAQVDTPGSASAVAFSDRWVAVADGGAGLAVIDVAEPAAARVVRQIDLGITPRGVVTAGPFGYVGLESGEVVAVDLVNGTILGRLATGSSLQDVAIDREFLYALTQDRLFVISLEDGEFALRGSVSAPGLAGAGGRRFRLFAGGALAYATDSFGYRTFSLSNPVQPALVVDVDTAQAGWKQLVPNGSGLGLAAVGLNSTAEGPHDISLYDLSSPTNNNVFLATFPTPGLASAVSIFDALAFVADGASGLQVINFRDYDRFGQSPSVSLTTSAATNLANANSLLRVTAAVADDVQVRNVEFYVDGVLVATDGNFPFEYRFMTPALDVQRTNLIVRAKATDTGGNAAWSDSLILTLVPDGTPPRPTLFVPPDQSVNQSGTISLVSVVFNEAVDPATVRPESCTLYEAGADGRLGTPDDVTVPGVTLRYRADLPGIEFQLDRPLGPGLYRGVLRAPLAGPGNLVLTGERTWTFSVRAPVQWALDADGFWDVAANWSGGVVPQASDYVVLDRPAGHYVVTYRSGNVTLSRLDSAETLLVTGGTLGVAQRSTLHGDVTVTGGTIEGPGDFVVDGLLRWEGGNMHGPGRTVANGGLLLSGPSGKVLDARTLDNAGDASWRDAGPIVGYFGATVNNLAGATFRAESDAALGYVCCLGAGPTFNNFGTFRKTGGTNATTFTSTAFNNAGVVEVLTGSFVLGGGTSGASSGAFQLAAGAAWDLAGANYRLDGGTIVTGAGLVRQTGGALTLTADVAVPNFTLANGNVLGPGRLTLTETSIWTGGNLQGPGAVDIAPGATLTATGPSGKTLDGRTLNVAGSFVWEDVGNIAAYNGATVNTLPGGMFAARGDAVFGYVCCIGTPPTVNNSGLFRKEAGTNATLFNSSTFNNDGIVEVRSGRLEFNGDSGTNRGSVRLERGTVYQLSGGNPGLNRAEFTGPGLARLNAELRVLGPSSAEFCELAGGRLRGPATFTVSNRLDWTAGDMTGPGLTEIPEGSTLAVRGPAGKALDGRSLDVGGLLEWSDAGGIAAFNGATVNIFSNGVFAAQNDAGFGYICCVGAPPTINNHGVFRKSPGTNTTSFNTTYFNNLGQIDLASGRLEFNNDSGTNQGTVHLASDTVLQLNGGNPTFNGANFDGPGLVRANAELKVLGSSSADRLELFSGRLRGPADFTVRQLLDWTGGEMVGPGTTVIAPGAAATVRTATGKSLDARTLSNAGSLQWTDGGIAGLNGATVRNEPEGTIELRGDVGLGYVNFVGAIPSFHNAGRLRKVGPAGTSQFYNVAFTNSGLLELQSGTLSLTRQFVQTTGGTLRTEVRGPIPGTDFGRLTTDGQAILAGTFEVSQTAGDEPGLGDVLQPLAYGSRIGEFEAFNGLTISSSRRYQESYAPTGLTLTVVPAP